jgi:hypothetical protein
VLHCVQLTEMVLAAIPTHLKLRADLHMHTDTQHNLAATPAHAAANLLLSKVCLSMLAASGICAQKATARSTFVTITEVHGQVLLRRGSDCSQGWRCRDWQLPQLTLYVAPACFACRMLSKILLRLPSKSIAHWLRLHVARVACLRLMATADKQDLCTANLHLAA